MHLLNAKFMLRELAARRAYGLSMMLQAEEEGGEELKALARQPQVLALKQVRALLPRSAPLGGGTCTHTPASQPAASSSGSSGSQQSQQQQQQ